MQIKSTVIALSLLAAVSSAPAMTVQNIGPADVSYDETTTFGYLSGWSSSGSTYSFSWTVPSSMQITSFGPTVTLLVALPSFTVTPSPGWALSGGFNSFLGNPTFTELGGATTNIAATADVSVNGGPAVTGSGLVGFVITAFAPPFIGGYFSDSVTLAVGSFTSLALSNASLTLSASGGTFSNILSNPQNKLEYSFTAMPVPEPESYAMLLSGLGVLVWLTRRRRQQP